MQVDEQERDDERAHERATRGSRDRERDERGEAEAGDWHEALRHARVPERRQGVPEPRVRRQARPEREEDRDDGADREHGGQPAPRPREQQQPGRREDRRRPAEEDEALGVPALLAAHEVAPAGRVLRDRVERPSGGKV